MRTLKGPAIFLAQFAGDQAPYDSLPGLARWAAGHGYKGVQEPGQPPRVLFRGGPGLSEAAVRATRVPSGHPEGYLEAFAQIYTDAAELVWAWKEGRTPDPALTGIVPGVEAGVRGVAFIAAAVASSGRDAAWTRIEA